MNTDNEANYMDEQLVGNSETQNMEIGNFSYNEENFNEAISCSIKINGQVNSVEEYIGKVKGCNIPSTYSNADSLMDDLHKISIDVESSSKIHDMLNSMQLEIKENSNLDFSKLELSVEEDNTEIETKQYSTWDKIWNTAGMGAAKFVEGVATGGEDIIEGALSIVGYTGGLLGAKDFQESLGEMIKKDVVGDFFSKQYQEGFLKEMNDASYMKYDSETAAIFKGAGVVGTYVIASFIPGGLATDVAVAYLGGQGSGTTRALREGMTYEEAMKEGNKEGIANAAFEVGGYGATKLVGKTAKILSNTKVGQEVITVAGKGKEVIGKIFNKTTGETIEETTKKFASEAAEEVASKEAAKETTAKLAKEAAEKAVKESNEKVAAEAAKETAAKAAKEAAEKTAKEATETAVKKAAEETAAKEAAKEAAAKLAKETAEKAAKEAAETATKKAAEEEAAKAAKEAIEKEARKAAEKAANKAAKEAAEEAAKEATAKAAKEAAEKTAKEATETATKKAAEESTAKLVKKMAENTAKKATETATKAGTEAEKMVAEKLAKKATDIATKKATEEATAKLAREAAEKAAKEATETATKKAAEESTAKAAKEIAEKEAKKVAKEAAEKATKRNLIETGASKLDTNMSEKYGYGDKLSNGSSKLDNVKDGLNIVKNKAVNTWNKIVDVPKSTNVAATIIGQAPIQILKQMNFSKNSISTSDSSDQDTPKSEPSNDGQGGYDEGYTGDGGNTPSGNNPSNGSDTPNENNPSNGSDTPNENNPSNGSDTPNENNPSNGNDTPSENNPSGGDNTSNGNDNSNGNGTSGGNNSSNGGNSTNVNKNSNKNKYSSTDKDDEKIVVPKANTNIKLSEDAKVNVPWDDIIIEDVSSNEESENTIKNSFLNSPIIVPSETTSETIVKANNGSNVLGTIGVLGAGIAAVGGGIALSKKMKNDKNEELNDEYLETTEKYNEFLKK